MSSAVPIAPHLPYLRRFARALTGSQARGDAYAVATLEAILAGQAILEPTLDDRVALYKVFLDIWTAAPLNHEPTAPGAAGPLGIADRNLGLMTPLPRVAFLLHAVEGFTTDEIVATLGRPRSEVDALIERAGGEIAAEISTDVLIIEDEPIIALDLEEIVEDLGHRVTTTARTRTEAVAAIAVRRPGLVLADIRLADGSSGLDAVHDILDQLKVPVVFITAYPELLLTGDRPEPTFLITKPFRAQTVKATVSQALFFFPSIA